MSVQIIRGNALALPLADDSVDLVVTSPPYFGLRSYQDGGEHYAGQIGDEPTPAEFVDALIAATREMVRVLKPSGSIWVNLGDKYAQSASQWQGSRRGNGATSQVSARHSAANEFAQGDWSEAPKMGRPKSLLGIPWRYAIRCIDDLGLILRAEVIWSKPNGLPESVTDRVRRSHEQWFHFTKEPRYFSAVDEIREAQGSHPWKGARQELRREPRDGAPGNDGKANMYLGQNPLGKLPGSVWTIATEPLHVPESLGIDHFAAFPTEWPRRIVQGWSPSGICTECGEGRRPVADVARITLTGSGGPSLVGGHGADGRVSGRARSEAHITGEACACPEPSWETSPDSGICVACGFGSDWSDACSQGCAAPTLPPTRPGVVLDPFGGTGTTALVADALGRHAISVDMSRDYCRLAEWRTTDPKQKAKAARKEYKPPAEQIDGQLDLLNIGEPA